MKVVIIKYNAGNVRSVQNALCRVGVESVISDNPEVIQSADKVIFPGVGEASAAMAYLNACNLSPVIKELKQPVLGICIGMQLLCRHSEEGNVNCLNIFDVDVKRFHNDNKELRIPEMGWNQIDNLSCAKLFEGIHPGDYVYYVHSYYAPVCSDTIAVTDYINPYSAALHRGNFYAVQFHPEKSGVVGEQILRNFLNIR